MSQRYNYSTINYSSLLILMMRPPLEPSGQGEYNSNNINFYATIVVCRTVRGGRWGLFLWGFAEGQSPPKNWRETRLSPPHHCCLTAHPMES